MASGIVMAALGGAGKAMQDVGAEGLSYLSRSALQSDYMEALKQRDQTLAEMQRQRDTQQQTFTAGENEKTRAQQERLQTERLTQERLMSADRTGLEQMRLEVEGGRAQEQARHNKAMEVIQAKTAGAQVANADLDRAIKQISLDNARAVKTLQDQYGKTTDPNEQKQIRERIQLLTGKDNDNFLPVPLKDELGNVTGYKIFDKKGGAWVSENGPAVQPPQAAIDALKKDPSLAAQFQSKYHVDPQQFLNAPATSAKPGFRRFDTGGQGIIGSLVQADQAQTDAEWQAAQEAMRRRAAAGMSH